MPCPRSRGARAGRLAGREPMPRRFSPRFDGSRMGDRRRFRAAAGRTLGAPVRRFVSGLRQRGLSREPVRQQFMRARRRYGALPLHRQEQAGRRSPGDRLSVRRIGNAGAGGCGGAQMYTARKFAWSNGSAAPWWAERAEVVNDHSGRRSGRLRAPIPPAGRRIPRPERTLTDKPKKDIWLRPLRKDWRRILNR